MNSRQRRTIYNLAISAGLSLLSVVSLADTIRVSPTGDDSNAGTSWASAKRSIGAAMAAASGSTQIWIAQGIYTERLTVGSGTALYGGFAGDESSLDTRHGDASVVDAAATGRVVGASGASNVVFDRLTFRNGYAWGYGAGMKLLNSGVTITDCVVENCVADGTGSGGGIYFGNGSATLSNVTFRKNRAGGGGGGFYAIGVVLSARDCSFDQNQAAKGGGFASDSGSGAIDLCTFSGNVATSTGAEGGGAAQLRRAQRLSVTRSFFTQNTANYGAALDLWECSNDVTNNVVSQNLAGTAAIFVRSSQNARITNNTIADNVSASGESAVYVANSSYAEFRNNVIAYNDGPEAAVGRDATSKYLWTYADFWANGNGPFTNPADLTSAGATNTQIDPMFLNRQILSDPLSYALVPESALIDYSDTDNAPSSDFAGGARPVNATGLTKAIADKGSFEYQGISQNVMLNGWYGLNGTGDQSNVLLNLQVCDGDGNLVSNDDMPQSASGFYVLRGDQFSAGSGPWTIKFSAPGYLTHTEYLGALPAFCSTGLHVTLYAGDVNGDNKVDMSDLTAVVVNFGGSAPDVNGDGFVGLDDLGEVIGSFGMSGD